MVQPKPKHSCTIRSEVSAYVATLPKANDQQVPVGLDTWCEITIACRTLQKYFPGQALRPLSTIGLRDSVRGIAGPSSSVFDGWLPIMIRHRWTAQPLEHKVIFGSVPHAGIILLGKYDQQEMGLVYDVKDELAFFKYHAPDAA